jgi:hypothetical protein
LLSPSELEMIAKQMGGAIAALLKPVLADVKSLTEQVATLESQLNAMPSASQLIDEVAKAIPVPKDGRDGIDGTSVTIEDVRSMVEEVAKSLPVPKDGRDGIDGKDGTSVTLEDVKPLIDEVAKALPAPKDGVDGKDGVSVTLEDVRSMVEEVAKSLPVPKDGRDGIDGKDGVSVTLEDVKPLIDEVAKAIPVPKDGASVTIEDVRSMVEEVAKSLPVPKDGRDALDINILPGIDFTKSYLRDTYATHDGGLWRAHATTEGERGWECVVDGVKSVEVEQLDERTVDITVSLASGKSTKKTMITPTAVYRGVFDVKSDKPYTRGDMATWAGSVWHCQVDETKAKPGENNQDWKLAVKAGRDANPTVKMK